MTTTLPVFVDATGRRARRLRAGAALSALSGLLVVGALILGALGPGRLPDLSTTRAEARVALQSPVAVTGPVTLTAGTHRRSAA